MTSIYNNKFVLKFKLRISLIATLLSLIILFSYLLYTDSAKGENMVRLLCIIILISLIIALIWQIIMYTQPYLFFVDLNNDEFVVNRVFGPSKKIKLSNIDGIAFKTSTYNLKTTNKLQFSVKPDVWCEYKNISQKNKYKEKYEEMYIVLTDTSQSSKEYYNLLNFLSMKHDFVLNEFVEPVLGQYPGKIKEFNNSTIENEQSPIYTYKDRHNHPVNPAIKWHKLRQIVSYFIGTFFITFMLIALITLLFGITTGIFW